MRPVRIALAWTKGCIIAYWVPFCGAAMLNMMFASASDDRLMKYMIPSRTNIRNRLTDRLRVAVTGRRSVVDSSRLRQAILMTKNVTLPKLSMMPMKTKRTSSVLPSVVRQPIMASGGNEVHRMDLMNLKSSTNSATRSRIYHTIKNIRRPRFRPENAYALR